MKKIALLFLVWFLLRLTTSLSAQNYVPFPDSNASWREGCSGSGPSVPPVVVCQEIENYLTGDTIIGAYTYQKVWQLGARWDNNCSHYVYNWNTYQGAIRQDIPQKKVYFLPPSQTHDTLLYDFNLHIGDTLPVTYNTGNDGLGVINVVSSIDSVWIGNHFSKRFWISANLSPNYAALIEGIGSTTGLLNKILPMFEWGCNLFCFSQNGTTVYPDTNYLCPVVSINENALPDNLPITISPNPVTTTLNISGLTTSATAEIYDISGKLLITKQLNTTQLDISRLAKGLYFIKLTNTEGSLVRKFVKE